MTPPSTNAELSRRLKDVEDLLEDHDKNLIRGFDSKNLSVVARMKAAEEKVDKIEANLSKLVWLVGSTLLILIVNLLAKKL